MGKKLGSMTHKNIWEKSYWETKGYVSFPNVVYRMIMNMYYYLKKGIILKLIWEMLS